jgi:hypothetical protein
MKITGDVNLGNATLTNSELTNVKIKDFSSIQKQCVECLQPIEKGEKVLVIFATEMYLDSEQISLQEPYLVHITQKNNKYCAEDFIARLLNPIVEEPSKPA